MVESTIITAIRRYIESLNKYDIHASRLVLFGSFARGDADEYSDIDLVVIAPELEGPRELKLVEKLWLAKASADNRIEPIPCGEQEWETDGSRPILEIARREGVIITV
jgi:predicted nucleotidyltransferase